MKQLGIACGGLVVIALGWYLVWSQLMAGDVARVKASIDHNYQRIKTAERYVTLKADEVYATGFPFGFRVAVDRPTLSQVWGTQSYAISFDHIELEKVGDDDGRYRVIASSSFDALYAEDGKAPEKYRVSVNAMPGLLLRAAGSSRECPNLPGAKRCEPVADDAPLNAYAVQLPSNLVLDVSLNGKTQKIGFNLMPINLPIFQTIPDRMSGPLTIFVGMLREALVFRE